MILITREKLLFRNQRRKIDFSLLIEARSREVARKSFQQNMILGRSRGEKAYRIGEK